MKTIAFFSSLLLVCLFYSCKENDLCQLKQDETYGSIEEVLDLDCAVGEPNNLVIRSEEAFQSLFNTTPCNGELPTIDFSQYSILGQFGGATGCERFYSRSVQVKENTQEYIFTVTVSECGGCEPFEMRWHWVLVPVIPEGYSVSFVFETL